MPIHFETDLSKDLTTFIFEGEVTLSEMLETMKAYGRRGVTLHEIYDIRQLEGERISNEEIDSLANYFIQYGGVRPENSKTAVVVADILDYGIARMIDNLTDGQIPYRNEVFKSMEEALKWLQE